MTPGYCRDAQKIDCDVNGHLRIPAGRKPALPGVEGFPMKRRSFLKTTASAALGSLGASSLIDNLTSVAAATSTTALQSGDYKALVCVFLFGGNDGDNTVIPYGQSEYDDYARAR